VHLLIIMWRSTSEFNMEYRDIEMT
jgi:hypothetical protein